MGFNFFAKKKKPKARDIVWMHSIAKRDGFLKVFREYPEAIVVAWFSETISTYEDFFRSKNVQAHIHKASQLFSSRAEGKTVIMLEHYPLLSKEEEDTNKWNAGELIFLVALDEPLLEKFGGERIIEMMKKMGMAEDESLEHKMISSSIRNAQEKMDKKITNELHANSAHEWFAINLPE